MNWINDHILTLVTFFPLLGALGLLFIPGNQKELIKRVTLIVSVLELMFSLHLYFHFTGSGLSQFEFVESYPWIPAWNINYLMGIDGVSLLLILLTTILTPLIIWSSFSAITTRVKEFMVWFLILETGMIGVFGALDLFLFYVFWEVMLIPMYFIIGIWGGKDKVYAALKFFIYTFAGSVLMLVGILYMYFQAGESFSLLELYEHGFSFEEQYWLFLAFAIAFAIKVPLFPVHTWLPDAHVQAPTAGSVILAGVLLKMGTYGFFRFAMPLFPEALVNFQPYLIALCVIGIIYGALVAMVQPDMKKLIAYSSVSHLGVVMLGIFCLEETAIVGGLYQMINHGVSTGALFLLVGVLYERTHSREIAHHGGLAKLAPWYTTAFIIVTLSSIGMPLTNGFIGEFLVLAGTFQVQKGAAILGATGVILSAVYMLWLVQRVFFGEVKLEAPSLKEKVFPDLTRREVFILIPFLVFIFWMGIYPKPFLAKLAPPVTHLLGQMNL